MKGTNMISFNFASTEEAFQEYINKRKISSAQVTVESVHYNPNTMKFDVKVQPATIKS